MKRTKMKVENKKYIFAHNFLMGILIASLIINVSCKKQSIPTDAFKNLTTKYCKGEEIRLASDTTLINPLDIQIFDSLAICSDLAQSTGFSIVNLKNGNLVRRFAFGGNGPGEMNLLAVNFGRTNSSKYITVYEQNSPHRMFKYSIDSLIRKRIYKPKEYCCMPREASFNYPLLINDSIIIGTVENKINYLLGFLNIRDHHFLQYNPIISVKGDQHYLNKDMINWTLGRLHGKIVAKPHGNMIAYFSLKGAIMDISTINFAEAKINRSVYNNFYMPEFKIIGGKDWSKAELMRNCKYGFNDVTCTDNKIYALFNGKLASTNEITDLFSNVILVYDWSGCPCETIILDESCYAISIDPDNPDYLYALRSFDKIGIRRYKL